MTMAVPLFYYTSYDEFKCFHHLGLIWTSVGVAGAGVYLTEMPPVCGRMTLSEHFHGNREDGYVMTEVCLETNSNVIPVKKLVGHTDGKIWFSNTQLCLTSFVSIYFAAPDSSWMRNDVKNLIKKQHLTLNPYTKPPVSQLQEMVVKSGIQPEYDERFDGRLYVCTVSVSSQKEVGKGTTKQSAKHEAAKCLIRKLILGTHENSQTETKHVNFNEQKIAGTVQNNVATLPDSVHYVHLEETSSNISVSDADASASSEGLAKRGDFSRASSEDESISRVNYNPAGKLQEYCVSKRLPLPIYDITIPVVRNSEGNNFTVTVKVGDIVSEGSSDVKKRAKKAAAQQMLYKLEALTDREFWERSGKNVVKHDYIGSEEVSNPIGRLQELCMANGLPLPDYSDADEGGVAHAKIFTVKCSLCDRCEYGTGSSKKDAKHNAALKMWKIFTKR